MNHAIGRARVPHTATIYGQDVMSDATVDLFRTLASWSTTYPQATPPAIETTPETLTAASGDFRDGYAHGYTDAITRRRTASTGPDWTAMGNTIVFDDTLTAEQKISLMTGLCVRALVDLGGDSLTVAAAKVGVDEDEAYVLAADHIAYATGRWPAITALPCPDWCTLDHTGDTDGDQLHESTATTVTGVRDSVLTNRHFTAAVQVESFVSGDGTYTEPPMVTLSITPVERPEADESAVDGMPAELVRHLAARIMCGTDCGEDVSLPPSVAVELGRALIAAGMAGGAR